MISVISAFGNEFSSDPFQKGKADPLCLGHIYGIFRSMFLIQLHFSEKLGVTVTGKLIRSACRHLSRLSMACVCVKGMRHKNITTLPFKEVKYV